MSVRALTKVWNYSRNRGGDLLILLAIADFADDRGTAFPSVSTLSKKARLSDRQVQRALRKLVRCGELSIESGKGPHATNLYHLTICRGDISSDDKMSADDILGIEGVTPMSSKPSEETVIKRETGKGDTKSLPRGKTENQCCRNFEVFWNAYPKKEGKGACRKWWEKHKPDLCLVQMMLAKIDQAKQTQKWKEQEGRFIPMPSTWLNQERWEDEHPVALEPIERIPL